MSASRWSSPGRAAVIEIAESVVAIAVGIAVEIAVEIAVRGEVVEAPPLATSASGVAAPVIGKIQIQIINHGARRGKRRGERGWI
jgi:hypothetical protein